MADLPGASFAGQSNEAFVIKSLKTLFASANGQTTLTLIASLTTSPPANALGQYLSTNVPDQLAPLDLDMLAALEAFSTPDTQAALADILNGKKLKAAQRTSLTALMSSLSNNIYIQALQAAGDFLAAPAHLGELYSLLLQSDPNC